MRRRPGPGRHLLAVLVLCVPLLSGCEVFDLFDRPDGALAGSATSDPALVWVTDGLAPAWRITDNGAGFASAAGSAKARRAYVVHGAPDVAVEWMWSSGGFGALTTSGLVHTSLLGPVDSGLRVTWWFNTYFLLEDGIIIGSSPEMAPPTTSTLGRIEVVGDQARYVHNGLAAVDWVPWSGVTTGLHGLFARDDAGVAKVSMVGFDTLGEDERPYYLPHDLDVTGSTDQTVALNDFVRSVPDGSTIRFPRVATIWCQQLALYGRSGLTFEANRSTLWQRAMPSDHVAVVQAYSGNDLSFIDLNVRGAFPDGGVGMFATARGKVPGPYFGTDRVGSHGLRLEGVHGAEIVNLNVREVFGDGIYIGNWDDPAYPSIAGPVGYRVPDDITITGGSVRTNGRQGITVVSGTNITVQGRSEADRLLVTDIARSSIDLEPGGFWDRIDGVDLRHIEVGTSTWVLAAEGAAPPRTYGAPLDHTGQDELFQGLPTALDTQAEYLADPRGFRRINNVRLWDWHLPSRPFAASVGFNDSTPDGRRISSRRHGWTFEGIRSWDDTGDRTNSFGAMVVLWQVDDVHIDDIRARFGPMLPMHFASVDSATGVPATGLTIGPDMDLGGTNGRGDPYPPAFVGDVRYNGVTVNGPYP